jgi:AraC-like DNA-binding protein
MEHGGNRRPAESIAYARPSGLEGAVTMRVRDSPIVWRVLHQTYTICNTLPSIGRGADWMYRGELHIAHAGVTMLIEPGETHCNVHTDGPLSFDTLMLDACVVDGLLRELGARGPLHFESAQLENGTVYRAFAALFEACERSGNTLEQQAYLAGGLGLLVRGHAERRTRVRTRWERDAIARVRDYLHAHLTENVSLDELVTITGLSRFHLLRVFTRSVGLPPHEYQLASRVARARHLLECGRKPVDVGADLGFADQSHFGRCFRRHVGATPGEYARATCR